MRAFFELFAERLASTTPGEYGLMASALAVGMMVFVGEVGTSLITSFN